MDKKNIIIFDSPKELASGFAAIINKKIDELLKTKAELNIALSGGNTPKEFFKELASEYSRKIDWNRLNFYWADERCVEPASRESNFGNAYNTLFKNISISPARLHRIKGELPAEKESARYSDFVEHNVPPRNSLPEFDIILLGIGEDGHTASIFPGQMELLTSARLFAVSNHPENLQIRITMTGNVINNAKFIYFLVSGTTKISIVNEILSGSEKAKQYPASYIKPVQGDLFWVISK
ncbi:MAG TPA: 6-phosphogluconolactonase [Ignavibacteria bacterium]|nr:6-phosphogluconolactonase [Ignavibacteria bacterium]